MKPNKYYAGVYTRLFNDLKYKVRDDDDKVLELTIILIFLIEFITGAHPESVFIKAPFIKEINITKPKENMIEFSKAINGKGRLVKPLNDFKNNNIPLFNYIKNQGKNKGLKRTLQEKSFVQKGDSKGLVKMKVETEIFEEQNNVSHFVNKTVFNKKLKTWNTQRDDRVRKTVFHNEVDRNEIPIDEWFKVGEHKALFPAHSTLRDYDRYNCRCFLTYK